MAPDRVMVLADWVRWKHRFTVLVLSLIATTVAACVIGLWALNEVNTERARNVARNTATQERIIAENRRLIVANCENVEEFKAGVRAFLAERPSGDSLLAEFDAIVPQADCSVVAAGHTP